MPLVYIPLEAVVSKWYGESEKMLAGEHMCRTEGWVCVTQKVAVSGMDQLLHAGRRQRHCRAPHGLQVHGGGELQHPGCRRAVLMDTGSSLPLSPHWP